MTTLREAAQQALEALEIGYDSAQAEATQYHAAMAGYRPERHAAMDADVEKIAKTIISLKAALAQEEPEHQPGCALLKIPSRDCDCRQEQEPVAWVDEASIAWLAEHPRGIVTTRLVSQKSPERQIPIYTHPPRREWQSLSEEEAKDLAGEDYIFGAIIEFARAIEAALKEKNYE